MGRHSLSWYVYSLSSSLLYVLHTLFSLFFFFFFSSSFLKTSLFLSFFLLSKLNYFFLQGPAKKAIQRISPTSCLDWTPIALLTRPLISKTRSISTLLLFCMISLLFFSFHFISFHFFYITSHPVLQEIICRQRQPTQLLS